MIRLLLLAAGFVFGAWQLRDLRRAVDAQTETLEHIVGRLMALSAETTAGFDSHEFAAVSAADKAVLLDTPGRDRARWN